MPQSYVHPSAHKLVYYYRYIASPCHYEFFLREVSWADIVLAGPGIGTGFDASKNLEKLISAAGEQKAIILIFPKARISDTCIFLPQVHGGLIPAQNQHPQEKSSRSMPPPDRVAAPPCTPRMSPCRWQPRVRGCGAPDAAGSAVRGCFRKRRLRIFSA